MNAESSTRPLKTGSASILLATVALLMAPFSITQAADGIFQPYSARYAVYRNDKLQARAEFLLQKQGESWVIKSESIGTHGMAKFLKFRDYEFVEGTVENNAFKPLHYVHDLKWMGPNQSSTADFDWESKTVSVTDNGDSKTLELVDGAVDPMSLQLAMRRQLESPTPRLEFMLVDKDEIELQTFRKLPAERLETSLGCLRTQPVEKVRRSSTRFTRIWHASEFNYIPVRMEHGKTDGDQMELRITELVIDGVVVEPQPGCASQQGSSASQ
jgi:hypothetical protein